MPSKACSQAPASLAAVTRGHRRGPPGSSQDTAGRAQVAGRKREAQRLHEGGTLAGGGGAESERGVPGMPRGASFRLWAVREAEAGSGLGWPLGALRALPGPGSRLQSSYRRRGRNEWFEGPGGRIPFSPNVSGVPSPPARRRLPREVEKVAWEHEAVSPLPDQLSSFRAGAATSGGAELRLPAATR